MSNTWTKQYLDNDMMWPAEPLIRMFRGKHYPNSELYACDFANSDLVDVGCGDGCNFVLYHQLGFRRLCGVEITDEICEVNSKRLSNLGIDTEMKTGTNDNIPYEDGSFDTLVSWNAGYYMGTEDKYFTFEEYMDEFSRVMKKDGLFIFSIPMADHEIFKECSMIDDKYAIIRRDALGIRNGIVFRRFKDEADLVSTLESHFYDVRLGAVCDDYFGTAAHWHIGYAKRR